ncbi:MAG TPA: beta-propeller domain-containing protein [Candidatus Thermoplasmatota archaeon]|nr:beta-propeller domain-containing protein [Candidatus Thermoplasmatota archaeon]
MDAWRTLAVTLALLPFAGCMTGDGGVTHLGLFAFQPAERGDPTPVTVDSCADLLEDLNRNALDQSRVYLEQSAKNGWGGYWGLGGDVAMAAGSTGTSPPMAAMEDASASGAQVTGTNNQEAAADEADLVKTDGEWTYVLSGGTLHILHSANVGDVEPYGEMEFGPTWGGQILLESRDPDDPDDDRLLVILPGQSAESNGLILLDDGTRERTAWGMTRIVVLSLQDRDSPRIEEETWIEGQPAGARLVDGTAYVIVHRYEQDLGLQTWAYPDEEDLKRHGLTWEEYDRIPAEGQERIREDVARRADAENRQAIEGLDLEDHLPVMLHSYGRLVLPEPVGEGDCENVLITPGSTGRGFSTILALDLAGRTLESSATEVMGGSPVVYASGDTLVLAAPSQDSWWYWAEPGLEEATDLQWFDLDGLEVTPRASGRVLGTVLDSFSLDVEGDELRVATTTGTWGRWWLEAPEPMMSHVAVFEAVLGTLVPRGIVGGIAPGERIWSARFTEDRAYLVTFRQMDPLWVIDLGGAVPEILGELEIPGVSTYLHPLDDDALLTIGIGPREDGQGLDWNRVQVSLFDVSDPSDPERADVLDLAPAGGWSWSSATQEHKAFTYWSEVGTLAVPLSTHRNYETSGDGQSVWVNEQHIGLRLVEVDRENLELRLRGEVDQDALLAQSNAYSAEIERSYFLGYPETGPVSVYAVSPLGVTAHDLLTLEEQGSVAFDASEPSPYLIMD